METIYIQIKGKYQEIPRWLRYGIISAIVSLIVMIIVGRKDTLTGFRGTSSFVMPSYILMEGFDLYDLLLWVQYLISTIFWFGIGAILGKFIKHPILLIVILFILSYVCGFIWLLVGFS